jgi:16S rRNA (adenine(1408)-N(1))-methyltransferase
VGAGDGHASLTAARRAADTFAIALDASTDRLRDGARAALRQRLPNALFVVASIEQLPHELDGRADAVTISFPWGSLLRGLVTADPCVMVPLARLAKPGATVRVLLSVEPSDAAAGLRPLDAATLRANAAAYRAAGFRLERCDIAMAQEIRAAGSSWAKRLGQDRRVFVIELRRM